MRRLLALICAAALAALLCACGGGADTTPEAEPYRVYFAVTDRGRSAAAVDYEQRIPAEGSLLVPALTRMLLAGPEDPLLSSPFPDGVRLLSWNLQDGRLTLDLSEQYGGLSGVSLTLADYCIVLTLSQVPGVESVCITVDGEELSYRQTQQLETGDILLPGTENGVAWISAALWYPRAGGDGLGVEHRQVAKAGEDTLRGAILTAWLAGPDDQDLADCVPEGTEIRSLELRDGICSVNFSAQFRSGEPADPAQGRLLLYALVNTMGGLDSVNGVQLLVEGRPLDTYGGVDTSQPLTPDLSLEKN